ncbi:MAG: transketolase [Alphaproteobacteria bacterium]|nr:transketolase [Alphaproteobacteria bacterium]
MSGITDLRLAADAATAPEPERLRILRALEKKLLWLSAWQIHNANHIRPSRDGLKVGGHQASCASVISIMTALFFDLLRPQDRIAVKPHAGPVFHAINYLLGRERVERMQMLRQVGGVQSYPSRVKDGPEVDFSTGSVGLGVAMTTFATLVQDYIRLKGMAPAGSKAGRTVAIVGDAELDEGNIYEALLEGWKHDIRDCWWIIDYNRQSLDSIVPDRLFNRIKGLFGDMGWQVHTLKYGKLLQAAFTRPGGEALRQWIDDCPNSLYSALTFQGGPAWREYLVTDLGREKGVRELIDGLDDAALHRLMTNLGGHDIEYLLESLRAVAGADDRPTCFIAYTIKGMGLPFAGHKDNHAGLMTKEQMAGFKQEMGIADGQEWDKFAGLDVPVEALEEFLRTVPYAQPFPEDAAAGRRVVGRRRSAPVIPVPARLSFPKPGARKMSTQEGFGQILSEIGREDTEFARAIVTTSPDVTVSTNLGPWVNRRGVFARKVQNDVFRDRKVVSAQKWVMNPDGQHIELGIAEQNLFLLLATLGLSHDLFGTRLLPVGTLYDPFIKRGLDCLNYACYQDARFMMVATPSGVTLAPEGGQHQAFYTTLIGMGQDRMAYFEPAYVDELAAIMGWGFRHMQAPEGEGGSVMLRLSTRGLAQPERSLDDAAAAAVIEGAYWAVPPAEGAALALVYQGAVAPEALAAFEEIRTEVPGAGLLAVTSADRLHAGWLAAQRARARGERGAQSWIEGLLGALPREAALVTVLDGHPLTFSWLGSVCGQRVHPLGIDRFGQSGDLPDLYRLYGLDLEAILGAAAQGLLER